MLAFIALTFILSGCGGNKQLTEEEQIAITKDNYQNYVDIGLRVYHVTREDGTIIDSNDSKVYSDSRVRYAVIVTPKENVKVNRIDLSAMANLEIYYFYFDNSLGGNRSQWEIVALDCNSMVFNEYVTSYSFNYKKEKLQVAYNRGIEVYEIFGTVTVTH